MTTLDAPPPTPFNFLSLGAGVQSSTIALMIATKAIDETIDGAIFSDTISEPAEVYRWLDFLEEEISESPNPFPIYRVTAGSLRDRELQLRVSGKSGKTYRKSAIPAFVKKPEGGVGIVSRKCTTDHKIIPITKKVRELAGIKRGQKVVTVTQMIGISRDEIVRMKPSREPWCQHRWPLIELGMRRQDCLDWMKRNGFPEPPRSACTFCPFHSDHEWQRLKQDHPKDFADAVLFEKQLQDAAKQDQAMRSIPYLHRSLVPIGEIDFTPSDKRGDGFVFDFQSECEGLCGV
jgi:hypothetical protein